MSIVEMEMIIHAFISSRRDYCNTLFTCFSNSSLKRLQVVQNVAAKLLTKSSKRSHITPILITLHWLPVKFRIQNKIIVLVFRALHGQAFFYLNELLQPYNSSRNLRSSKQILLVVPRSRLKTKGDCAFEVVAPKLWNALPLNLRSVDSVDIFKKQRNGLFCARQFSSPLTNAKPPDIDGNVDAFTGKSTYHPVHKQLNLCKRTIIYSISVNVCKLPCT